MVIPKNKQRVEKHPGWRPRALRAVLPGAPDLMAGGGRRAQGRCLSQLLRSTTSEDDQSLHVLARGDKSNASMFTFLSVLSLHLTIPCHSFASPKSCSTHARLFRSAFS